MTPQEKAIELYEKFIIYTDVDIQNSKVEIYNTKQCALIAVDECLHTCIESMIYYWQEVKQEIEKL